MKKYLIDGQKISVPTNYSEITYRQYKKLFATKKREIELISILIDVDVDTLQNVRVGEAWLQLVKDLQFITKPIDIENYVIPTSVAIADKTVSIPFDIGKETMAQYTDMRDLLKDDDNEGNISMAVAIYLQPLIDGEYNINKARNLRHQIENLPADFVICVGGFFLSNSLGLKNGFLKTYRKGGTVMMRSKQAMSSLAKRLAF